MQAIIKLHFNSKNGIPVTETVIKALQQQLPHWTQKNESSNKIKVDPANVVIKTVQPNLKKWYGFIINKFML